MVPRVKQKAEIGKAEIEILVIKLNGLKESSPHVCPVPQRLHVVYNGYADAVSCVVIVDRGSSLTTLCFAGRDYGWLSRIKHGDNVR